MKQYVCLECGCVFDEDDILHLYDTHGLDFGPYEHYACSPCCRESYVDAYECDCCGEIITTDQYVEIDDKKYCWDCVTIKRLEEI